MTFLEQIEQTPPAARMVLPGAILTLVSREKHPIIWWAFGLLPMAAAVATALTERRLFGPKAPAPTVQGSSAPFMPGEDYPGQRLPEKPDFFYPDGSPGYVIR